MSTSKTTATTIDPLATVLLALRRMPRASPEEVLPHLYSPKYPDDCHYLDALATLCSFAAPCDSVASAIRLSEESNELYLATSSPPPSALKDQVATWIELLKKLPVGSRACEDGHGPEPGEYSDSDSDFDDYDYESTPSIQSFIVGVYSACHVGLSDIINRDDLGRKVLVSAQEYNGTFGTYHEIPWSQLTHDLELLIAMGERKPLTSAEDLLNLHRAATAITEFENQFYEDRYATFFEAICSITDAVDTLIRFSTSAKHHAKLEAPWNIVLVDGAGCAPDFIASANTDELARIFNHKQPLSGQLASAEWKSFRPRSSENLRLLQADEGQDPRVYFTGPGVVHCESALLDYLLQNDLSQVVERYIGSSRPVCYACMTLIRVYDWTFDTVFRVGCRSDLDEIDIAWAYPSRLGPTAYRRLVQDAANDLRALFSASP